MPLNSRLAERRARTGGFTLFELIVVIVLVAILSGMLLRRFINYQEMAERVAMEQTAGAVRSALTIQLAGLIARGKLEDAPRLESINPMNFLSEPQKNYVGEFFSVKPGDIPAGSWYYDLKSRQLVYTVQHDAHFTSSKKGEKAVRYKVSLVYNDNLFVPAGNAASQKEIGGVTLKVIYPYTWNLQ